MRKVSAAHALLEAYKERLQRANEAMLRAFQVRGRGEGRDARYTRCRPTHVGARGCGTDSPISIGKGLWCRCPHVGFEGQEEAASLSPGKRAQLRKSGLLTGRQAGRRVGRVSVSGG